MEQEINLEGIDKMSEEDLKEIVKHFSDMGTLRELKGISDEQLEAVYSTAYNFYQAGNYPDAEKLFSFLTLVEHTSSRFWTALGSAQQAQKKFADAVKAYQMGAFLDLENPKPMYYAAECFFTLGELENAKMALASLEEYAPENEQGRSYKAKGAALKKVIEAK